MIRRFFEKTGLWLVGAAALVLAVGLKAWLVASQSVPFNSDEAVVALMARYILSGSRPVFFFGQAYMGSLDAWLIAGGFALFGQQVWVIRLVQGLLYIGVLGTTVILGRQAFGNFKVGVLAALLLAIPTVNVTLYTTASLGGYGEALLIGNLLLIVGLRIIHRMQEEGKVGKVWLWLLLGFLAGFGLWAFGLTLVYVLPVGVGLLWQLYRLPQPGSGRLSRLRQAAVPLGALLLGGLLGLAPLWGYAARYGFSQMLDELSGGAIAGIEGLSWLGQVWQHLVNLLLLGSIVVFGQRPPWGVTWLALPLLPFVFLFWMAVLVYIGRTLRNPDARHVPLAILRGVMLALMLGFIFTPFGADPSGRYFLPLAVPLALFASAMLVELGEMKRFWTYGLTLLLLTYNLWGTVQCAQRFPPGITTQFYEPAQVDQRQISELITFLDEHGERYGYTNYWVSYPLAFLSQERLIYVPRLPYHLDFRYSERDDRYLPYDEVVSQADKVAYITTNHPALDQYLRQHLDELGVNCLEVQFGDFHVFYALSRPVGPSEIGLGVTTTP